MLKSRNFYIFVSFFFLWHDYIYIYKLVACDNIFKSINVDTEISMMTSSNGNIFHVTGHLSGEFNRHRWIPRPHKGQWRGALMFSLICARINGWVNNREAGDLRRHRAHCDVTIMLSLVHDVMAWKQLSPYWRFARPPVNDGFRAQKISNAELLYFFVVCLYRLLNKSYLRRKDTMMTPWCIIAQKVMSLNGCCSHFSPFTCKGNWKGFVKFVKQNNTFKSLECWNPKTL